MDIKVVGVMIGRFCPIHLGHTNTIDKMISDVGEENSLIVVGSADSPLTIRNVFSYTERRDFVRAIYPTIKVVGLPDVPSSNLEWKSLLEDMVDSIFTGRHETFIYGGSKNDIWYYKFFPAWKAMINYRRDFPQSATMIRERLINNQSIEGLVPPKIERDIKDIFKDKWVTLCSL
jgi:bifunctional NMN adenylyltransferase/nudix hydrolase